MKWLCNWLAKKLAPEVFDQAERYHWLRGELNEAHRWLGEFPEIEALTTRLSANEQSRYRALGEAVPYCRWWGDISQFREKLRRGEHLTAPAE